MFLIKLSFMPLICPRASRGFLQFIVHKMMKFRQMLLEFYRKGLEKREFADLFLQASDSFLLLVEAEDEMHRSASSFASSSKASRLFKSSSFATTLLFAYFLERVKAGKAEQLHMVLKTMPELLRKYEKQLEVERRRTFLSKLVAFSDELSFVGERAAEGGAVDCLLAEVFASFEGEAGLLCELLGSFGEGLESMEKMHRNDYCNLLAALDVSCSLLDCGQKAVKTMGGGDVKLYLANTPQGFHTSSQKEHQRELLAGKQRDAEGSEKQGSPDSQRPQDKFKGDFLEELLRLRQEFEENTGKVAGLLSFRDCGQAEEASHI